MRGLSDAAAALSYEESPWRHVTGRVTPVPIERAVPVDPDIPVMKWETATAALKQDRRTHRESVSPNVPPTYVHGAAALAGFPATAQAA